MTLSRRQILMTLAPLAAASTALAQDSPDPIQVQWSRPFPRLSELVVSGDGQRIVALSLDGNLACFNLDGHLLWERPSVAANALAISRTGALLAAWSRSSRPASNLLLFNDAGRCFAAPHLAGSPTSVAFSGVGKLMAVGVGESISIFRVSPKGLVTRPVQAAGRVKRIMAAFGDTFLVITEPPCRVALIKSHGEERWHLDLPENANCSAVVSTDGKLVALAYEKVRGMIDIRLLTWKNEEVWRATRKGRDGSVRMNGDGGVVLLAYEHLVEHYKQSRYERRLSYLGEGGDGGWTKGGAFTAPVPVALDSGGQWLVVVLDNERSRTGSRFRLYGKEGTPQWIYNAPTGVHLATASASGRTIAVYQADGRLSALSVNASSTGG